MMRFLCWLFGFKSKPTVFPTDHIASRETVLANYERQKAATERAMAAKVVNVALPSGYTDAYPKIRVPTSDPKEWLP